MSDYNYCSRPLEEKNVFNSLSLRIYVGIFRFNMHSIGSSSPQPLGQTLKPILLEESRPPPAPQEDAVQLITPVSFMQHRTAAKYIIFVSLSPRHQQAPAVSPNRNKMRDIDLPRELPTMMIRMIGRTSLRRVACP